MQNNLEDLCFKKACYIIQNKLIDGYGDEVDIFELTDLLIKIEKEKEYKNNKSDLSIDYNDEITNIEYVGEKETIDISVTGDNLFYCNGILTKNSYGLPATCDFMIALVNNEELESLNQLLIKQLKNRYTNLSNTRKFVIGIDREKMKLYNIEQNAQAVFTDEPINSKVELVESLKTKAISDFKF